MFSQHSSTECCPTCCYINASFCFVKKKEEEEEIQSSNNDDHHVAFKYRMEKIRTGLCSSWHTPFSIFFCIYHTHIHVVFKCAYKGRGCLVTLKWPALVQSFTSVRVVQRKLLRLPLCVPPFADLPEPIKLCCGEVLAANSGAPNLS